MPLEMDLPGEDWNETPKVSTPPQNVKSIFDGQTHDPQAIFVADDTLRSGIGQKKEWNRVYPDSDPRDDGIDYVF